MAGALVSVSLNVLLIPHFGFHGAIGTALAVECTTILVQVTLILKSGRSHLVFPSGAWKHLAAGLLMAAIQWGGLSGAVAPPVRLFTVWGVSALVYVLALWALRDRLVCDAVAMLGRLKRA